MSTYEVLSIAISILALIVSGIAFFYSRSATDKANAISMGNLEMVIHERITSTKEKFAEYSVQYGFAEVNKNPEQAELLKRIVKMAIENNLNAYEEACGLYIDNKVDKVRFRKTYRTEIKQLVENKDMKEHFDAVTSSYKAILKVYNEWENLEK